MDKFKNDATLFNNFSLFVGGRRRQTSYHIIEYHWDICSHLKVFRCYFMQVLRRKKNPVFLICWELQINGKRYIYIYFSEKKIIFFFWFIRI